MAEYIAFDPDAIVIGRAMLAITDAMGPDAKPFLVAYDFDPIDPDKWYSQQKFLDLLKAVATEGPCNMLDLVSIGMNLARRAIFPPHINSVEAGLLALNAAYQNNTKGINVGSYIIKEINDHQLDVIGENPFPCDLGYGVVYGTVQRFRTPGVEFTVYHDDTLPCRKRGDMSCTYHVALKEPEKVNKPTEFTSPTHA